MFILVAVEAVVGDEDVGEMAMVEVELQRVCPLQTILRATQDKLKPNSNKNIKHRNTEANPASCTKLMHSYSMVTKQCNLSQRPAHSRGRTQEGVGIGVFVN